jgi:hypothetical protein
MAMQPLQSRSKAHNLWKKSAETTSAIARVMARAQKTIQVLQ